MHAHIAQHQHLQLQHSQHIAVTVAVPKTIAPTASALHRASFFSNSTRQQHMQHSNTAPALLSAVTAFAATFPEATALRHSQGLHQQHTSATYATAAYIAPAHATTAFEARFTAKTISQGSYHSSTQTIALHNIKTPSKTTAQVNNTCYNCVHTSNSTGSHISFSHSTLCHLLKQHPKR